MKSINQYVNETKSNEYEIYFNYKENKIKIHKKGDNDLESNFETIDEAVKAIYNKEEGKAYISIIPSDKLIKYILEH